MEGGAAGDLVPGPVSRRGLDVARPAQPGLVLAQAATRAPGRNAERNQHEYCSRPSHLLFFFFGTIGRTIEKVDPRPGSEVQTRSPSCARTMRLTKARPSPNPPNWRVAEPSAWVKSRNTSSIPSSGMPIPRSLTACSTHRVRPFEGATPAAIGTLPSTGEYLV